MEVRDLGIAAQSVQGGAVYLFSGELVGRNLVVTGLDVAATGEVEGTAVAGSGAFSELDLAFLSIGGNHAAAPTCAGSAVWAVSAVGALSHAAIAGNTFTCDRVNGGAVAIEAGDPWAVRYTDVFGHADGDWSGMPDPTGVDGNLAVDPAFADPARGDLHLAAGSPLIDAGDPALLGPDGTAADIGGYGGPTAP